MSMSASLRAYPLYRRGAWLDDVLCAVLFFLLFNGVLALCLISTQLSDGYATLFSFLAAGLISILVMFVMRGGRLVKFLGSLGVPGPEGLPRVVYVAFIASLPAVGIALVYGAFAQHLAVAAPPRAPIVGTETILSGVGAPVWRVLLVLLAAPFWEEVIFRGLLYKDLKRQFGIRLALIASALIFAFLHPVFAFVPVFVLGLCAAGALEFSGSLLAPILVHVAYNSVVLIVHA
jgi:membrane protease YdiL (CAAX protease family)